jgi:tRNA A-37 threonylcarbamoyl transferase component Bud32/tetratricopeptide (TPR) repeat protein
MSSFGTQDGEQRTGQRLIEYARRQTAQAEPVRRMTTDEPPPEDTITGYTLVERIHRGGQGVVYKAEQHSTGRYVAVKLLRNDPLSTPLDRIRFRREIDILSKLKHPNIVTLHDGGTAGGFHYLVMDYVDGMPLDEFVRQNDLDIEQTLRLMLKVCRVVSAAHVAGVIHRDLKPRNILVDRQGEPHILDFGLAKATDMCQSTPVHEAATITGQFVGSLTWASPEQAEGARDRVDVRTDVHALGLILFHLLTGQWPFELTGAMHAALRNIVEHEPVRPSRYRNDLDDDLDIIILTSLAKERDKRYQSAAALAVDLERHLAGEPIEAKRDSTWYVLRKTVNRYRWAALTVGAIAALSLVYGITMTAMYGRATQAEQDAERSATQARAAFRKSQETIELLVNDVARRLAELDGAEETRRLILDNAYTRLQDLLAVKEDDPALLQDYAQMLHGLGDIDQALGRHARAFEHLTEALEIRRSLVELFPDAPEHQVALSIALVRVGDVSRVLGDRNLTHDYYAQALEIDERLHAADPENLHYADNLLWSHERVGGLARRDGRIGTAREHFDRQLQLAGELLEYDPSSAAYLNGMRRARGQLAGVAIDLEDWAAAAEHVRSIVEISEKIFDLEPSNMRARRTLASAYLATVSSLCRTGAADEARENCAKADALIRPLVELHPEHPESLHLLRKYHAAMSAIAWEAGDMDTGSQHVHAARHVVEKLAQHEPGNVETQERLFGSLSALMSDARRHGDEREGRAMYARARGIAEELMATGRASFDLMFHYARLLNEAWPEDLRDTPEAIRICTLAAEGTDFQDPAIIRLLGALYVANGQPEAAIATYKRAASCTGAQGTPILEQIRKELTHLQADKPLDARTRPSLEYEESAP